MDEIATKMVQQKRLSVLAELQCLTTSPATVNRSEDMDDTSEVRVRL